MSYRTAFIALAILATYVPPAVAQTIQLPEFGFTTVSTTVLVPDGGTALLGGVNSARYGRTQRGTPLLGGRPFNNVATGSELSGNTIGVTAYIHDLDAMDKALLAQAAAMRNRGRLAVDGRQQRRIGLNPAAPSVAEIRRRQAAEQQLVSNRHQEWLDRARQAEAQQKPKVAKIYYRMAWRDATGPLKAQLAAKLAQREDEGTRGLGDKRTVGQ
ncbi:MAG: type II and III secretion system protein [Planctomycetota bacterium]|nr:type II and III secretion system protein [Planctomycetota bacterium]